jgi:hypothetical protein
VKAESKTKDFILFFTEAHPNFLSQREKKLVKAESKTYKISLNFFVRLPIICIFAQTCKAYQYKTRHNKPKK